LKEFDLKIVFVVDHLMIVCFYSFVHEIVNGVTCKSFMQFEENPILWLLEIHILRATTTAYMYYRADFIGL